MSGNTARRTSITYPNGRQVHLDYGTADSIEDSFNLVWKRGLATTACCPIGSF